MKTNEHGRCSMSELKKQSKQRTKRRKESEIKRLWLIGSRNWKDKKAIRFLLNNFSYKDVDFVMLDVRPGLGQVALPIVKGLKFDVVLVPVNTERDGINAAYFRNASRFAQLKPSHVFIFNDGELDSSMRQLISLAKSKNKEWQIITTKKAKKISG
jgi:MinD-like ATPase involved in chromosome partitioning or flagellar assembly